MLPRSPNEQGAPYASNAQRSRGAYPPFAGGSSPTPGPYARGMAPSGQFGAEQWGGAPSDTTSVGETMGRRPGWWLRFTSWGWDQPQSQLRARERTRRSQLLSWLLLGLIVADLLVIPLGIGDTGTLIAVLVIMGGLALSAALNRRGLITVAGTVPMIVICLAIFFSLLTEPNGALDLDAIPAYDLLVIAVIIASAVLEPWLGFVVALVNTGLILADYFLQPHALDLNTDIASYTPPAVGVVTLLARPIALEIIIATIAFLWSRGMSNALQRADRAEELATLQRQIVDEKRALDVGIAALLDVHTRASNGDFSARVGSIPQQNALWTVAISLNNLMNRIQRSAMAEQQMVRTHQELERMNSALQDLLAGRRAFLPPSPVGNVDPSLERLRQLILALSAGPAASPPDSRALRPISPPGAYPTNAQDGGYSGTPSSFPPQSGPGQSAAYPYQPFYGEEDYRRGDR